MSIRRILLSLSLLLVPVLSYAHGDSLSFEKEVGPYLIDIGYDTVGFRPDELVTFDFDVFRNPDVPTFEPFDVVHVDILQGEAVLLAQDIPNQKNFVPSMTYTFPEAGAYTLHVAYMKDGQTFAEASFSIAVSANSGAVGRIENVLTYVVAAGLVLFTFVYVVWSYLTRRRNA